jgi:hypothetical protein
VTRDRDSEAQRLTIEEVDGPSAPKMQLNNLDRLVTIPYPFNRNKQASGFDR